jgi:hypothetical protein
MSSIWFVYATSNPNIHLNQILDEDFKEVKS